MFQKLCVKELSLDISDGILFKSYRVDTMHGYSHDLIMKRIYRRLLEDHNLFGTSMASIVECHWFRFIKFGVQLQKRGKMMTFLVMLWLFCGCKDVSYVE